MVPMGLGTLSAPIQNLHEAIGEIIHQHGLRYQYADDIQLYILAHGELNDAMTSLSHCLKVVRGWMGSTG